MSRSAPPRPSGSGWPSEACDADEILDVAHRWADLLAAQPPLAVQGTKLAVNAQIKQALLSSFDLSTALEIACFHSADHAEAVNAFVDKRPATFHGR